MKVGFRQSFAKDLEGVKDKSLLRRVQATIEAVEKAESPGRITGLKKLKGGGNYYRLRIGDFRIGMAVEGDKINFFALASNALNHLNHLTHLNVFTTQMCK